MHALFCRAPCSAIHDELHETTRPLVVSMPLHHLSTTLLPPSAVQSSPSLPSGPGAAGPARPQSGPQAAGHLPGAAALEAGHPPPLRAGLHARPAGRSPGLCGPVPRPARGRGAGLGPGRQPLPDQGGCSWGSQGGLIESGPASIQAGGPALLQAELDPPPLGHPTRRPGPGSRSWWPCA